MCFPPKRADLIVADLTITESREKVVDFTVPYMYYTEDILMKKPSSKNGEIDLLQFMNPFHRNVWFATLASLVTISIAVFVINYYSPYGYKDENGRGTSEEFSFFNSVWFALACMLQQGGDNTPKGLSGRVGLLFLNLFNAWFMTQKYKAYCYFFYFILFYFFIHTYTLWFF